MKNAEKRKKASRDKTRSRCAFWGIEPPGMLKNGSKKRVKIVFVIP
jgi:hypothetical protein